MIHYVEGNLLEADVEAFINTVNTVGVMGKGVALLFKEKYPETFKKYKIACDKGEISIGKMFVTDESTFEDRKLIINFPTKTHWQYPSEYSFIEGGLMSLKETIEKYKIKSLAMPPIGCGNGGLDWRKVKILIEKHLGELETDILIFESL